MTRREVGWASPSTPSRLCGVSPAGIGYAPGVGALLALWTRASKLTRVAADQAMGRYGVYVGQNLVLGVLWEEDGLTPGELAERLHLATPRW